MWIDLNKNRLSSDIRVTDNAGNKVIHEEQIFLDGN